MLFGLCNASETFQQAMDLIFQLDKWHFALVYLDDIIIISQTPDEHIEHATPVFSLLQRADVN